MNFLDHYNAELRHLRDSGTRFAREHPQVAARLGLHPDAVTDPFVERLLEGVAFLAARVHTRLDRECAEFARHALASLAPLFMRATPAISTFAFHPDFSSPEAYRGQAIPRGTVINAVLKGRPQPVQFTTAREVTLWPIRLAAAECARSLTAVPALLAAELTDTQGVIRLRFELEGSTTLSDLLRDGGNRPLHLSLAGDLPQAYAAHRTLLADTRKWFAVLPGDAGETVLPLPLDALRLAGTLEEEALLPPDLGGFPGLRLLREYFAQPHRFLGIELDLMHAVTAAVPGARAFDLVFGLSRSPTQLLGEVTPELFRLFATPVINLYPKRLDPVPYNPDKTEQWLPVDRLRPGAHHLWSLSEVHVCQQDGQSQPARSVLDGGEYGVEPAGARWTLRTEVAELADGSRRERADPLSTHDLLTITLPGQAIELDEIATVLARGLVADRGWQPQALLDARLQLTDARAVHRIECLWPASAPRPIPTLDACWAAVRRLGADVLAARTAGRLDVTARIAEHIALAAQSGDPLDRQRLGSLRSAHLTPGFARAHRHNPMAWVRSLRLDIDIATADHADQGGWVFGRVLAQALAESSTLNDGIEVHLLLDGEPGSVHSNTERADGGLQ
jgi:type VI secretion system protein ImpG